MGGVTFQTVAGEDINLNDVTIANVTGGADENSADTVKIWDAATSGYQTFYRYYEAEYPEDEGWYDAVGEEDPTLAIGTAFWYKAKAGTNKAITFAGSLETASDVKVDLVGGKFNMVINPFPAAINLNDASTVTIANVTGGADENSADTVKIWDAATSGYQTYYHYYEAEYPDDEAWYDAVGEEDPVIPANTAFWYKAKAGSDKSITFPKPY